MSKSTSPSTVLITGDTYPVKDQLRALGGKWEAGVRGWRVPADKAAEARKLVADAAYARTKDAPSASGKRDAVALVAGGARHSSCRSNQKSGSCETCGDYKKPGEGRLVYCVEDSGCLEHHDRSGYHLYCKESDAAGCKTRREAARAAEKVRRDAAVTAAKAADEAKKVERDAYQAYKQALKDRGFDSTSAAISFVFAEGEVLAKMADFYRCSIRKGVVKDAPEVEAYVEAANGHDDWRTYIWAPVAQCHQWRLAHAAKVGITVEKAREYMAKYSGCDGADVYQAVLLEDAMQKEEANSTTPADDAVAATPIAE